MNNFYPKSLTMNVTPYPYSILSLFAGAGGLDLGFEMEGFRVLEAIDINPWAIQTLQKNRKQWNAKLGDVRSYSPQLSEQPDVLLAGVPCQGFSLGGNRQESDPRNLLYQEVIRIAEICQPRIILIENVLNLRTMRSPQTGLPFSETIIQDLNRIGYQVVSDIFKVCHYGVPQTRRRFIFIGFRDKFPLAYQLPPLGEVTTIREFIYDLARGEGGELPNHNPQWGFKSKVHRETGNSFNLEEEVLPVRLSRTASDGHPIRSYDAPFPAIDSATIWGWAQGNVVAGRYEKDRLNGEFVRNSKSTVPLWRIEASRIRSFTHREYARLQTFPDDWVFVGGNKRDIHLQIGNAVPVKFAQQLAMNIRTALDCLNQGVRFGENSQEKRSPNCELEKMPEYRQLSLF
jgi:DNA (cytosine-5)-methyltransferase 1